MIPTSAAIYHMITEANVNDITAAKAMPIEAGAICLGLYDYGWWAALDDADCRIGSRRIRRSIRRRPCLSRLEQAL